MTVLSPVGFPPKVSRQTPAPRLDGLDGETVYLVDCRFDDSDIFLSQVQAWFAQHLPRVRTVVQRISNVYRRAYVDGTDPITGRPVMQEVLEGLTRPFEADELGPTEFDRSTPRLVEADSEDTLQRRFVENRWTDMLPIVLPTEARVAEMLRHTKRQPDEIVGRMRSTHFREHWAYSVEKVAVNAVMAGERPEYFPVILALPATGVTARSSSSSAMAAMAVVTGPVREEIGMNGAT